MNKRQKFISAIVKSTRSLGSAFPLIVSVIFLTALIQTVFPPQVIGNLFHNTIFFDAFVGSTVGSILVGSPVTSYIIGGELLNNGVSLTAVTAFIVAWVTVGVVQFPVEAAALGQRFAFQRNAISFILSIIVAMSTVFIFRLL